MMFDPVKFVRPRLSLHDALAAASTTKLLHIGRHVLGDVPAAFRKLFGNREALIVADPNTFEAAGKSVYDAFRRVNMDTRVPFLFTDPVLHAEHKFVEELEAVLRAGNDIPVAIGSGTINDITKLAAHKTGRPYMIVATAASMDGYTAFGASITHRGSKQTFSCPAPTGAIADLDVIARAPEGMNSSGYADLIAKTAAGADWLLADALNIEAVDPLSWQMVQVPLRDWLADPEGVRSGDHDAIANLIEGLMMSGFGMQQHRSSRPASGADHQFSHLWDMQHHTHNGIAPSHGFKVGIGTLASTRLFEFLLDYPVESLDADACAAAWPALDAIDAEIRGHLGDGELGDKGIEETRAKYVDSDKIRAQIELLRARWPEARKALKHHLPSASLISDMLTAAGAPADSGQIGISPARLRESYRQAYYIRRRFTVLDVAVHAKLLERALDVMPGTNEEPTAQRTGV